MQTLSEILEDLAKDDDMSFHFAQKTMKRAAQALSGVRCPENIREPKLELTDDQVRQIAELMGGDIARSCEQYLYAKSIDEIKMRGFEDRYQGRDPNTDGLGSAQSAMYFQGYYWDDPSRNPYKIGA